MAEKLSRGGGGRDARVSPFKSQPTRSKRDCASPKTDESFPKRDRLLKRSDFIRVQRRGRKIGTRSLLILLFPGPAGTTRLGIATSKKVGKSVFRNRLKRVIRELFRRNRELFPSSMDIVIIPKRVRHSLDYRLLLDELRACSRRMPR